MIAIITGLILIVYFSFVIAVSKWVYKKQQKTSVKWVASIGTAVFLLSAPMADNIIGEIYFRYLCATQGGIHVYQTVELGSEYFDESGAPKFIDSKGNIKTEMLNDYDFTREQDRNFHTVFRIVKIIYRVRNNKSGHVAGDRITYFFYGGWLVNSTGMHARGAQCPTTKDVPLTDLINNIFTKN